MDAQNIKTLLSQHGFKFSKSMGQNFLVDKNIPEKIVRLSGIGSSDGVLEVGPGAGALTMELSRSAGKVTAVELDKRLIPILQANLEGRENVEIVEGDILKLDIAATVQEKMPGLRHRVCANLPYNITTPALSAFIDAGVFETITVMVQKEVAERICADPGTRQYGAFSVYANYHTEAELLFDVPPECFMPRPNVTSSVVTLRTRQERILPPEDEPQFFRVVRAAFGQRRKTLVNALYTVFGNELGKDEITDVVTQCGFNPQIRGETLGIEEFAKLSTALASATRLG
ncbi:MAG: 16S rRNA (adenine(1518)-N(6)/adenine(1519)-N(6))-dimethyltransferase RsmA [Oscillospiraceae bacterium]|nr:16S rRNA (adenine(1518)-N(6)/adenine(1519)-N(6))-dimethyltransferase RsmA [Oscillospiraceae bacterium]